MAAAISIFPRSVGVGRSAMQRAIFAAFLMSLTWGTMLTQVSGSMFVFLGKPLCGYVWVLQGAFAALALALCRKGPITFPVLAWLPWLVWIAIRCDFGDFGTAQRTIMLLAAPFVGMAASAVIVRREDLAWLLGAFRIIVPVSAVLFLAFQLRLLPTGIWVGGAAGIMTLCLAGSYCAPYVYEGRLKYVLMWLCCVAVCAFSGGRMATATSISTLPLSPARKPLSSRVFLSVVAAALALVVFSLPHMEEKMSRSGTATPMEIMENPDDLYDSGRSGMWEAYWDEAWKTPVFGAGGNASNYFGASIAGWAHPHNEYLRVFFDYGILGLLLLGAPMGYTLIYTHRAIRAASDRVLRDAWTVSCGGLISMLLLAITDNVILYVAFFGCLLFGILGAAHGVEATEGQAELVRRSLARKATGSV